MYVLHSFPIFTPLTCQTSNSYTMGCPPVRGDNPPALASGLSYVHVDKHGITMRVDYLTYRWTNMV